ncbi:iron only hydrogenase large subunit-like protein [Parabacteroides sp. PFB2-10]|uniref:[Fe-Fe] hydrogenase large subunit C-terminal domain-containing protein n=1 Tax=Parabacteroides sp. PFB2-10 TaxID=1742405 RepID=UPI002473D45E|nr:[Fe-Fe] hydrogenase large subunit C-terminal domain-containing protein [Parabacteroides sp. PFB2-10]MDH6311870.1 iron only hydrogenase large subunit-like protein [Parabacteroides sp. PFB2-10]MDL2244018.1 4Fe-4S binding protein [Parabacteroides sp. OttesenSCG-928-J18]
MKEDNFYHALEIDNDLCMGCTRCMTKCPTRAIRIKDGKATIHKDWCVDCGECLKTCPVHAIYVGQDDFQRIFDYTCRVALVPTVFTGQFSKYTTEKEIMSAIYELGFTHIFPVEFTTDMVCREMIRQMENADEKPVISSFCPAIVRLIQVRFPVLVDNILLVKPPVNASATYYHKVLEDEGFTPDEIGIFYVTPCAAKIAALKSEEGYEAAIRGVINMDTLYNKVYHVLKNRPKDHKSDCELPPSLTKKEMRWSQTGGESKHFPGRSLAIDEIHNVIDFLERMETTDEVRNVDFLELRACSRSCAGGVLTVANRFLTAERMMKRSVNRDKVPMIYAAENIDALAYLKQHIMMPPIPPKPKLLYDGPREEILKKMEQVRNLMCYLPGIDCGACGSPNCRSLAEDIVRHEAQFSDCVFMQRNMEKHGKLDKEHAFRLIEKTWGKDRLNKDCYKKGAKYEGQ